MLLLLYMPLHAHRNTQTEKRIDGLKSEISIWLCVYLYTHTQKSMLFSDVTSSNADHCGIK